MGTFQNGIVSGANSDEVLLRRKGLMETMVPGIFLLNAGICGM
jgi:hypothetical protein